MKNAHAPHAAAAVNSRARGDGHGHAAAKRTPGLVPLQQQMYTAMAEAFLGPPVSPTRLAASRQSRPVVLKEGELPRPVKNEFYQEARYFYAPPQEPADLRCTACVNCAEAAPALATIKCYSCAKFDARRVGLYCAACFPARHPHHRQPHTWLPLSEAENLDEASKGQRVRAEFDHRIAASKELLHSIQASQRLLVAQQADELPKELLSDARDLVAHAESEVSRVRRKLQDDVNLRAAVASGALPAAELQDSSRGWAEPLPSGAGPLTPHVLAPKPKKTYMPLEGSKKSRRNSRSRSPNSRRGSRSAESSSSKKNEFQMRHVNIDQLRAAMIVEKAFRRYMGQKMAKMRCRQVWKRVWSDDKEAWYFVRDGDDDAPARTSWLPPKVLRGNGMDLCTPRSFARRKAHGEMELSYLYQRAEKQASKGPMTPERAATLVQGCWRRWLGKQKAIRVCAQQLQRVLDPNSGKHYFYNVKTGAVSWKQPAFMTKAAANEVIKTPRAFAMQAQLENRALGAEAEAARNGWGNEEWENGEGGEWGDEDGEWDGSYEGGRGDDFTELPENWEGLLDATTGEQYYFNSETNELSWEVPTA